MDKLLLTLIALACPVSMGTMMYFMMRPRAQQRHEQPGDDQRDHEIARLRDEVAELRAEQEERHDSERWAP